MDWSRTGSIPAILLWLLLSAGMWAGGWLLCAHVFRLRARERLPAGLALGLWLYILLANLLGHLLPAAAAFVGANLAVLLAGLAAAWGAPRRERFPLQDLRHWQPWLALAGLFAIFLQINRGLAIFDDFVNLPIVSIIAAGEIPPRFYLNPESILDYHYGLHLAAAGLARIGGFYPWAAFDIYKALSIALAGVLGALWFRRYWRGELAVALSALLVLFAGGARWLLLLLPAGLLERISQGVALAGSAMQSASGLTAALAGPWRIEGGGAADFPFALVNGISWPLSFGMSSAGGMAPLALYLLLLLARRRWTPAQGLLAGAVIASLALVSEHLFVMVWAGIFLAALLQLALLRRRGERGASSAAPAWAWLLLPGALLAPWMGGVITGIFHRAWAAVILGERLTGPGMPGLALRWPPAVVSAHLGVLRLDSPGQVLLALAEIGPLLLLAPLATRAIPKYLRAGKLLAAGLAIMALVSAGAPLVIRFTERERDIARLTGGALSIWLALGLPYAWQAARRGAQLTRLALGAAFAVALLPGLALFPIQLAAGLQPQASYFIEPADVWMSSRHWDGLAPGAWALDTAFPYRPAALFARTTGPAYQSVYIENNDFLALLGNPNAGDVARAGYRYVYVDRKTWGAWTPELRREYQQGCARLLDEHKTAAGDFRRLYDLQACGELE